MTALVTCNLIRPASACNDGGLMQQHMTTDRDTIFALSSGRPPAAIAVVRVSGPAARDAIMALAGRVPQPRQATLLRLKIPCSDGGGPHSGSAVEPIDDALVLWFPGPRSETGEDTAEFQLHGGYAEIGR